MATHVTHIIGAISLVFFITIGFIFRNKLHHLKKYGILGIFLMTLIGNSSIFSPIGPIASVFGGRVYPPWFVGIVAATGSVLGEIITYNIGGIAEETNIEDKKWYNTVNQFMEKNGFPTIVLVTSIPNPFINFSAVVAGSIGYPLWKFLMASWLGNWIQFTICAALGSLTKKFPILNKIPFLKKN